MAVGNDPVENVHKTIAKVKEEMARLKSGDAPLPSGTAKRLVIELDKAAALLGDIERGTPEGAAALEVKQLKADILGRCTDGSQG